MIVHMIGNAHIDPVWLWRWQAGVDEALSSFRSAAERCEEYPEFVYTRGEAWLYQQVERLDPELFARVQRLVERGQWHITGGQYVQPDVNLPTETGLRRQILHGRRYFEDRFGVSPKVGYNVDSFGHPATLPDLLASFGYVGYVFHRPGPGQVELPAQAFRWRGAGGGEVLGFRIVPVYITRTDDLYGQIMLSVEAADPDLGHTMCFYGVGNHGGGPTKGNIEYILENADSLPDIELRFSTPRDFFDAVAAHREKLPVVTEELQHTFPGCYSVMHDIKQAQYHGEHLLDQCERAVEGFVEDEAEKRKFLDRIDTAWDDLLFTQFHDILAGTSVPAAWRSVRAMQGRAWISGEEVIVEGTRRWARRALPTVNHQQIVVVNPDTKPWEGVIEHEPFLEFDAWGERWLSDLEGNPVEFQLVQPEAASHAERVIFPVSVAAGGHKLLLVRDDPSPGSPAATDLEATPRRISNGRLRAGLDRSGVRELIIEGRNVLGEGGMGLHLRHDGSDTWTFHTDRFDEPVDEVFEADEVVVEETGPLRARVRLEGTLGGSRLRWTLTLHRDEPRLLIKVEANFNERFRILQMPVDLASLPERWTDGLAGGQVDRRPGPAEWPVQGWSRLEVDGHHLALVTADAYSLSLSEGGCWQWTLLRSPKMAWGGGQPLVYSGRDWHTDQGQHAFDFALHCAPRLDPAGLHTAARQRVQSPVVFDRYEGMNRPPWGGVPPRGLWLEAERRAHADGRLPDPGEGAAQPLFTRPQDNRAQNT